MKKRTAHWEDLLTLATLARTGSYSAAARELGLTHATVGRRIKRLEEAVGTAMIARSDSGFLLSDSGRLALTAAEGMERIAAGLGRSLAAQPAGLGGRVRVTATEVLGTCFYLPRLIDFHRQNPGIVLEMALDNRTLSLARRKADVAIRLARPQEPGVVAKFLGHLGYRLTLRRDHPYLAAGGTIDGPLPLCRFDDSLADLPESRWLADHLPRARCVFRANSLAALTQAVRCGWGAGLIPCFLADADPELIGLSDGAVVSREMWLAYPEEFRSVPRYRALIDWLIAVSKESAPLLAG